MLQQVPVILSDLVEAAIKEELVLIAAEQIKTDREYIKAEGEKVVYDCSSRLEALQEQLINYRATVEKLTLQVS